MLQTIRSFYATRVSMLQQLKKLGRAPAPVKSEEQEQLKTSLPEPAPAEIEQPSMCSKLSQSVSSLPPGPYPLGAVTPLLMFVAGASICAAAVLPFTTNSLGKASFTKILDELQLVEGAKAVTLGIEGAMLVVLLFLVVVIARAMHARDVFVGRSGLLVRSWHAMYLD